ncbi:Tn3 family transposase [Streptomyces mirabilis]|uniref:Tn3 family transposase n=1 Tax=Streptomyces mirabilis TaxID=68239 RepID=UPI0036AA5AA5
MFVLCLRILQSAPVYVNTLMLQDILGEPEWAELLTPVDRRGLTPLFWSHVRPYGDVNLDMDARLNLAAAAVPGPQTAAATPPDPPWKTHETCSATGSGPGRAGISPGATPTRGCPQARAWAGNGPGLAAWWQLPGEDRDTHRSGVKLAYWTNRQVRRSGLCLSCWMHESEPDILVCDGGSCRNFSSRDVPQPQGRVCTPVAMPGRTMSVPSPVRFLARAGTR